MFSRLASYPCLFLLRKYLGSSDNSKSALFSAAAMCVFLYASVLPASATVATTTTLAVTSSGSAVTTVASGSVITLTATVKSGSATVTTGQVNFCLASSTNCADIHLLGTAQLTGSGSATLKFVPGVGNHGYRAVFLGTTSAAASDSAVSALKVTGTGVYPATTSIAQSGSAGNYTLTATVSGNEGISPTGTVSFLDTTNANYLLGTAALGKSNTPASLGFVNSSKPATNPYPQAVAVADFNGDGKPDLAIPVYSIFTPLSDVSILLGNGDGTFTAAAVTPITGQNAGSVAVGDFNEDGKVDLAITLPDADSVVVMLGNGDGTFTASQTIPDADGPFFVTTGDFNGDGIADLAVVNPAGADLTILLGKGDGTFNAVSHPVSGGIPVSAAVGDFNSDGKMDLAVVNYSASVNDPSTVTILLGNGDGTFTPTTNSPVTGDDPLSIAVGDFNRDGIADLAVANSYVDTGKPGSVTILLGDGLGDFTPTAASPATGSLPYSVAVGDFNGDGVADLVTSNVASNTATVLLGKGDGTFTEAATPDAGSDPLFVAVGDFNGDGLADFAVANNSTNSIAVLLSQLTVTATATVSSISPVGSGTHLVDASFPGDSNYAASISGTTGLTAKPIATTLSLTADPTSSGLGQQVALTATLSPNLAQNHNASGTVAFYNGTASVGTGTLATGVATVNVTSLPVGTDSLTAVYPGDTNFAGSTSSAVSETVIMPDFSIAANPTSLSIAQGGSSTSVITITPTGGFSQALTLNCSGLPANSTCAFSPATVTPAGTPISSTMTITTDVQSSALAQTRTTGWLAIAMPLGPAGFAGLLGLLGIRRRNTSGSRRAFIRGFLFLAMVAMGTIAIGCGGGGSQQSSGPVTPVGSSTITVTASTAASGGTSHSSTLTLIVSK